MRRVIGRRRVAAGLAALTLLASLVADGVSRPAAAAPSDGTVAIDDYQPYEPQTECDPRARPGVVEFATLLLEAYPGTGWSGIERECHVRGRSEHKEGRAFDWAVSVDNPAQRDAAEHALGTLLETDDDGNAHALFRRFGLMYVIWNKQVFRSYRPEEGWQPYPCDPNASYDDCHVRHVHFSFSSAGAERRTSWWTAESPAPAPAPTADEEVQTAPVERIAGPRQIDTAVEVSRRAFPTAGSTQHVFVASAGAPHDAMVAAVLAGAHHGSVLLTGGSAAAEPEVDGEIRRVLGESDDRRLVFVGAAAALPDALLDEYRGDYRVSRIDGDDAVERAAEAAARVDALGRQRTAVVASLAAVDAALPMIAVAAANDWPLLFTAGDRLSDETRELLEQRGIVRVHVVGGPDQVSGAVVDDIAALPDTQVERHRGDDAAAMSVTVATRFFASPASFAIATAGDWPDAVVGAYYAGERRHAPVLLSDTAALPDVVVDYIEHNSQPDTRGIVLGGHAAIDPAVARELERSLRD